MNMAKKQYVPRYLQKKRLKLRELVLSVLISTSILLLVGWLWQIRWEGSDDFIINQALAGSNGVSTPYALVIQFPLSWMLYALYYLVPTLNLLGLAELFSVWISFTIFDYLLMKSNKKWGICYAAVFSLLFEPSFYMNLQYTRSAIILVLAGLALLLYCVDNRRGFLLELAGILLVWLGMMFRWDAGYLPLPYIGLLLVFRHGSILLTREKRRRLLGLAGFLLIGLMLISAVDNHAYQQMEEETGWISFNSKRAAAFDYLPAKYSENLNDVITENDHQMLRYNMILDEYFSAEVFEGIADAIEVQESTFDRKFDNFLGRLPEYLVKCVRNGKMAGEYNIFPMVLFSLIISCLFISKKSILMVLFTIGGTLLICFYFTWTGRFPAWVQEPLYLTAAFSLLYTIDLKNAFIRKLLSSRHIRVIFALFAVVCVLGMSLVSGTYCEVRQSRNFEDVELRQLMDTIEKDKEHIYVIDSFANSPYPIMDGYAIFEVQERGSWSNILRVGTWYLGHPFVEAQLSNLGVESLIKEIPEKEMRILTNIDSKTLEYYQIFLQEHYGMRVEPNLIYSGTKYALYTLVFQQGVG